ncbi:hypothetical protein E3U26_12820 (plasmid) [Paracoccus ferrooxidans]|nr:hypothetical protein E3U26_12820 [Paracoccus ferrooxidans]
MADIPNDLINQLLAALTGLGDAPQDITDPVREHHGSEIAMALDELLAASYQIVEAAGQSVTFPPDDV